MSTAIRYIRDFLAVVGCAAACAAPAAAQIDLSGSYTALFSQDWQIRIPGPDPVDYTGLPINAAARAVALDYDAQDLSTLGMQCLLYNPTYLLDGPGFLGLQREVDPKTGAVVAWDMVDVPNDTAPLKIWMDGRAQPSPYDLHSIHGFTTGQWEGNVLVTYTTHMKRWLLRRNGVPLSNQATMTEHWILNGNLLTVVGEIDDPVYLTEPYIYTRMLIRKPNGRPGIAASLSNSCVPEPENASSADYSVVPHYLPGHNPVLHYDQTYHGIPLFAALGGAETMYPAYQKRLTNYKPPAKCTQYCCGGDFSAIFTVKECPSFDGTGTPRRQPPLPTTIAP